MCGIIGYTGVNNAVPYLIEGLKKLEYRGYDSAGIALCTEEGISLVKRKGKVRVLEEGIDENLTGTTGIGHTRWATHGEPSQVNAHPHLSENGMFAVVHNGIIENCDKLKAELKNQGYSFISDTDTEVISQLLEKNYRGDLLSCLRETALSLEGSFAVAALHRDYPDTLLCLKKNSPLIVAKDDEGFFIMSDTLATQRHGLTYYMLSEGEFAIVSKKSALFFTGDGKPAEKSPCHIAYNGTSAEKGSFPHYMLKEIYEQPEALERTLSEYIKDGEIDFPCFEGCEEEIKRAGSIHMVACGSAYHAARLAEYVFHRLTDKTVFSHIASEFRYDEISLSEDSLVIIISQSGETADSIAALLRAKEKGAKALAIVNVKNSTIALNSNMVIPTLAGPEIAVATTKAFTCQLGVLYALACFMCEDAALKASFINELSLASEKMKAELSQAEKAFYVSELIKDSEHIYFIGRNTDFALSMEGALKMKEISYIHCEAYPAGELKHGTISLIEKGTPVVALCLRRDLMSKTLSAIKEVKARGAFIIVLTARELEKEITDADFVLTLKNQGEDDFTAFQGIVPLQLMSYYTAVKRNCDVDKPRNLAKSVTVE